VGKIDEAIGGFKKKSAIREKSEIAGVSWARPPEKAEIRKNAVLRIEKGDKPPAEFSCETKGKEIKPSEK